MPGRRPTLQDVAEKAGVDRSVASRVLSGDPRLNIREDTRERVAAAARDLRYRPNRVARGLRVARTDAYGLLIPDFSNPIYASIIVGAEEAVSEVLQGPIELVRRASTAPPP